MSQENKNMNWKIVSKEIINKQLQEYYQNNISFQPPTKRHQLVIRWMLFLGPFLTLMGIFISILIVVKSIAIYLIFLPLLMLLMGISLIVVVSYYMVKWTRLLKLYDKIMQKINLVEIYNLGLAHYFSSQLILKNISQTFQPAPSGLINFNSNTKIDTVFNLSHPMGKISFGTITHHVINKVNGKIDKEEFYRLPIFTVQPDAKLTAEFTIQPRSVLTNFFNPLTYINFDDKLFEGTFLVGGHHERVIKNFLIPKICKNLLVLASKSPTIPAIDVAQNVLTFLFQSYLVKNWNDKEMTLTQVDFSGSFNRVTDDIIAKIETDIIWLKECLIWLNQFGIMMV
ncbi:hypothetical protein [Spiroplasma endosymbiont of Glossina fuscipes fuscipes]|uniref:hypothetical protein n=1 Tax=Spiroplasma endosymbiont of Glossina fuscipes fuscipes TaxID=2004463 RepID=UPI003C77B681